MLYNASDTIYTLGIIVLGLLGFMALLFLIGSDNKRKEKELEMKYQNKVPSVKVKKKKQNDEIIDTLQFMLAHGIIDTKEYNTLMVKCLPFME